MNDGKIHIPAKKMVPNKQGGIKITLEAFELLAEVVNESGRSAKQVASESIIQAINGGLIVYHRRE